MADVNIFYEDMKLKQVFKSISQLINELQLSSIS